MQPFPSLTALLPSPRRRVKCFRPFFQLATLQTVVPLSPASAQERAGSAIDVAMQQVPAQTWAAFERHLDRARVPAPQRPDYHKWGRFYLDFCHKYGHPPGAATSLAPFLTKLAAKNQSVAQRSQASAAVRLLTQGRNTGTWRRRSASATTPPGPWRPTASGSLSFRRSCAPGPRANSAARRCAASFQTWPCDRAWRRPRRTRRLG